MSNIRAGDWLNYDATNEATEVGRQASALASAKKSGGGWGSLLGGILGQILIPIPGVGAAIGAGLGGMAGSIAGGKMSGVSQEDIRSGGKFHKGSREDILDTIAKNQLDSSLMSAAKYGIMGLNPNSMLSKGGGGFTKGAAGGGGLMGGLKGGWEGLSGGVPTAQVDGMSNDILNAPSGAAANYDITDIVKTIGPGDDVLGRTSEIVGGSQIGTEVFDTLGDTNMAQNLVQQQFQGPYSPEYLEWLKNNKGY